MIGKYPPIIFGDTTQMGSFSRMGLISESVIFPVFMRSSSTPKRVGISYALVEGN